MKNRNKKVEVELEVKEEVVGTPEVTEVTVEVAKPKMSLKKKLMIGGGVVVGLALGAAALFVKTAKPKIEEEGFSEVEVEGEVEVEVAEVTPVVEEDPTKKE